MSIPLAATYPKPIYSHATKITTPIPPVSGTQFSQGNVIRIELPSQGYLNPANTTLAFDVTLGCQNADDQYTARFQNNIQSIFSRVRLMYGSTPLEDILQYNQVVRNLTEWTVSAPEGSMDQNTIANGIGGITYGHNALDESYGFATEGLLNVRQKFIHGLNTYFKTYLAIDYPVGGSVPNSYDSRGVVYDAPYGDDTSRRATRRYQVKLALGLFCQEKLIPLKFMASQLAIEITLEQADSCILMNPKLRILPNYVAFYSVQNVELMAELMEFDADYDAMLLKGIQNGGVPIKFSSWHTFSYLAQGSRVTLQIKERSRSVKALFACLQSTYQTQLTDSGATVMSAGAGTMLDYQYRIGNKYFPTSPVLLTLPNTYASNGGAAAFAELQKALQTMGKNVSTGCVSTRWAYAGVSSQLDFSSNLLDFLPEGAVNVELADATLGFAGNLGSCCYASAISLETSSGVEISGLNCETIHDISFIANWTYTQQAATMNVFSYYDAMIILKENNVLQLIQ